MEKDEKNQEPFNNNDGKYKEARLSEMISELSQCRSDERSIHTRIIQVTAAAGTILGLIFNATFLNKTDEIELLHM